jgi:hypothetical protein
MDSSSVISPSSQLLLEEIRLAFIEIHKRFDESVARWDQRVAELLAPWEQQDVAEDLRVGAPKQFDAPVVADNWDRLFDGGNNSVEQHCEAQPMVADN